MCGKHDLSTHTSIKYEGGVFPLSRLAFSTYPFSEILALVLCKSDGDCIAVLSESPPEYPGRFIFFLWKVISGLFRREPCPF